MSDRPPYAVQTVQRGTHSAFDVEVVVGLAFLLLVALVLLPLW